MMSLRSLAAGLIAWAAAGSVFAAEFALKKGDHICIIGNTTAERMQHYGHLEALIVAKYPDYELVFRNLGYSGDEVDTGKRLRSMDFGSPDEWLAGNSPVPQGGKKLSEKDKVAENRFEHTNTKADVVFAFFGYNESYAGEKGLPQFKSQLENFVKHTLGQKYNGKSAPQLVLFTPFPQQVSDDVNLPAKKIVDEHNANLGLYAKAMVEVAKANEVHCVNLFELFPQAAAGVKGPLTINSIHLNAEGDKVLASACFRGLFAGDPPVVNEKLRAAINDKNWYWFHRYRTTDGYSTFGDRAFLKFAEGAGGYGPGRSNYGTVQRELEVLDLQTQTREKHVWAVAQGKEAKVEDKDLPPFFEVISNKPGPHNFLNGDESLQKMTVGKGLKVETFATEADFPELVNPVQMAFDPKGRLWVAAWRTYPHWKPLEKMDDKLLILEDTNHDGKADKCTTFAGDLHNPTGFEFWNGGVFVAQGPDVLFLKDTNGDDKYDVKERVIHGVDTADTHHTVNSFALDPGGALYMQEGTFHHSQVETPWGAARRVANGAVFRYEPRAQKFDVYVTFGFANPHGHAFDKWGQDFVYDGTGAQPYHGILFSGDMDFPQKHGRPPQVYQQRTRPCSAVEILSSKHFPEEFQGNLLVLNVIGVQGMLRYKVVDKDSSFGATELEPIVLSSDPNFRPADVEVGPDGAIYFTDWHNPIIGHMQHNLRDPSRDQTHGRVYRVRYEGRELLKPTPIAGEPIEKLLEVLKSPDDRERSRARIELSGRKPEEVAAAAKKWIDGLDAKDPNYQHNLTEGLWLHQSCNIVNEDLLKKVLKSPVFEARAAAVRVLIAWRDRVSNPIGLLQEAVNDESPRVRLMAVWGLSYFTGADAAKAGEVVIESLVHPQDDYLKFLLNETTKTLDKRTKEAK